MSPTPSQNPIPETIPLMTEHEYRSLDYVSQSSLKAFQASPLRYKASLDQCASASQSTSAMSLGTLAHALLLQSENFDDQYMVYSEESRPEQEKGMTSNRNKEWKLAWQDMARELGRSTISQGLLNQALDMVAALYVHPIGGKLFPKEKTVLREQVIIWRHPESDLPLKSRLDLMVLDEESRVCTVYDYKTTASENIDSFIYSIRRYGYDLQAAFYQDAALSYLDEHYGGTWSVHVQFIPQATRSPYIILRPIELDTPSLDKARNTYVKLLQELEGCMHTGIWEPTEVEVISLSKAEEPLFDDDEVIL